MKGLYVPLQANYYEDDRVLGLSMAAETLFTRGLGKAKAVLRDGLIDKRLVRAFCHPDALATLERHEAELVDAGLWVDAGKDWYIPSWLKHNKPREAIEARYEQYKQAGKVSAERRRQQDVEHDVQQDVEHDADTGFQRPVSDNVSVSVSVPDSVLALAVEGGAGGNGKAPAAPVAAPPAPSTPEPVPGYELPEAPDTGPEFNHGEYEPTDPAYAFDATWTGQSLLDRWQKRLGKIQPGQLMKAQNVLLRLHNYCRLSMRQIEAMVDIVLREPKARKFWGTGRSPAIWLDLKGSERVWQHVYAHLLRTGWELPRPEPGPVDPLMVAPDHPYGDPPEMDSACSCRNGVLPRHRAPANSPPGTVHCAACDLGRWKQSVAEWYAPKREPLPAADPDCGCTSGWVKAGPDALDPVNGMLPCSKCKRGKFFQARREKEAAL